jgi:hypothetical protein
MTGKRTSPGVGLPAGFPFSLAGGAGSSPTLRPLQHGSRSRPAPFRSVRRSRSRRLRLVAHESAKPHAGIEPEAAQSRKPRSLRRGLLGYHVQSSAQPEIETAMARALE